MKHLYPLSGLLILLVSAIDLAMAQTPFSLDQIMGYPFPNELVRARNINRITFAINERGQRNLYGAEGPEFQLRKITSYDVDDGQELSQVSISDDGQWIVYVRGGDFGSNWDDDDPVNPTFAPIPDPVSIWSIPFSGGTPIKIDEGVSPVIHPHGREIVYLKNSHIYRSSIDGSDDPIKIVGVNGSASDLRWSPDGSQLAFVSHRGDHSFVGIYNDSLRPIQWIAPSFQHDFSPRWSPESKQLVFVRQAASGGAPDSILSSVPDPYSIVVADVQSGSVSEIWRSPHNMRGSIPTTHGGTNLHWAKDKIVFLSYQDGWPHMYSINPDGSALTCLTPGNFMVEYISLSPDGKTLLASANTGPDPFDIDRRHLLKIDVAQGQSTIVTPGEGNEWAPQMLSDHERIVYIAADAKKPPEIAIKTTEEHVKLITESLIPQDFPLPELTTPSQVIFKAPDGTSIHATLFNPPTGTAKKPTVIYVHGGPPRQMLLGWHYSSYYSNAYAMNQYLASQGFAVLAVNYRLGIGYGYEFHRPPDGGVRGASEYQDIKAAAEWLAEQDFCDPDKIGIYGGSYGGYLTAMALARNSDLFAAGVDIHGVHDRTINRTSSYIYPDRYERAPDAATFKEIAWQSSPISSVDGWKSPVLIIHADDDRNVSFSQSTDLVNRLLKKETDMETMVVVDDTHHFMLYANQKKVNQATADFLIRKLRQ